MGSNLTIDDGAARIKIEDDIIKIFKPDDTQVIACAEGSDFYRFMKHINSTRFISDISRALDRNAMKEYIYSDFVVQMGIEQGSGIDEDDSEKVSDIEDSGDENQGINLEERGLLSQTQHIEQPHTITIHSRKEPISLHNWKEDVDRYTFQNNNPTQKLWYVIEEELYYDIYKALFDKKLHEKMEGIDLNQKGNTATAPETSNELVHNLQLFNECYMSYKKGHQLRDNFDEICEKLHQSIARFRTEVIDDLCKK